MAGPLIILARHPRAAADSAQRAGYDPIPLPFTGHHADTLRKLRTLPVTAPVMIGGDLENHPDLLDAIAFDRELLGCDPAAIRSVRAAGAMDHLPKIAGLRFPEIRTNASLGLRLKRLAFGSLHHRKYLRKPLASYHGQGIDWWTPTQAVGRDHVLQTYVRGQPMSAVFKADGWSAVLVGVSESLVGERAFHAPAFAWCGAIGPIQLSEKSRGALNHLAVALTQRHDLRGLFNLDLVQDFRGRLWPIEVNPRYPQSTDLLERATRSSALLRGVSASVNHPKHRRGHAPTLLGHAWLHAPADAACPNLASLVPAEHLLDAPPPGTLLTAGQPIALIEAAGHDREAIVKTLHQLAGEVSPHLQPAERPALTATTRDVPAIAPPPRPSIESVNVKRLPRDEDRPPPPRRQLE